MTSSSPHERERFIDFEWSVRPVFLICALLASVGALLLRLIDRMPDALAAIETSRAPGTLSLTSWLTITDTPLYWPYYTFIELTNTTGIDIRYISAGFALAAMLGMYAVFQTWFNRYYAALGALIMTCNTLFLSIALYATPASFVLFYVVMSVLAVTLLYRGKGYGYLLGAVTLSLSLYAGIVGIIGAMCQLSVLLYVLLRKRLQRPNIKMALSSAILFLLMATPAVYVAVNGYSTFWELTVFTFEQAFDTLKLLTIGSPRNTLLLPATWPLLEIGSFALLVLGVAVSIARRKADRYKFLLVLFTVALLAFLIGGQSGALRAFLLVPMAVLITAGLRYISDVWTSVFPKNKAATIIAHTATVSIVIVICVFHLLRYTTLLPQLPEYKQAFRPQTSVNAVQ